MRLPPTLSAAREDPDGGRKDAVFMSNPPKRTKKSAKRSPLSRILRGLYIILFSLSLVVVVSYVALKFFAPAPDLPTQVEFPIGPDESDAPEQPSGAVETPNTGNKLTLNRRKDVYTCLLLGVADQGGSDTIMLGVFDTAAKRASLISIPRDTVVRYNGSYIKINASYSYGGVEAVAQSVSQMLAVPIDYYVKVNLRAFREIVDEIDGVWFDVPVRMDYDDPYGDLYIHIAPGYQLLNGSCYANADIGRAATQRAFLAALAKQTITLSNVTKVTSLINILNTYVESDMPLNTMVYFGTQAVGMDLDTSLNMAGLPGKWINPFWQLEDDEILEIVNGLGIYEEQVPASVLRISHP